MAIKVSKNIKRISRFIKQSPTLRNSHLRVTFAIKHFLYHMMIDTNQVMYDHLENWDHDAEDLNQIKQSLIFFLEFLEYLDDTSPLWSLMENTKDFPPIFRYTMEFMLRGERIRWDTHPSLIAMIQAAIWLQLSTESTKFEMLLPWFAPQMDDFHPDELMVLFRSLDLEPIKEQFGFVPKEESPLIPENAVDLPWTSEVLQTKSERIILTLRDLNPDIDFTQREIDLEPIHGDMISLQTPMEIRPNSNKLEVSLPDAHPNILIPTPTREALAPQTAIAQKSNGFESTVNSWDQAEPTRDRYNDPKNDEKIMERVAIVHRSIPSISTHLRPV